MQSASVVATISPLALNTPSFLAPPPFCSSGITSSAYSSASSHVLSFELSHSTTMSSYSPLSSVCWQRDSRQAVC